MGSASPLANYPGIPHVANALGNMSHQLWYGLPACAATTPACDQSRHKNRVLVSSAMKQWPMATTGAWPLHSSRMRLCSKKRPRPVMYHGRHARSGM